MPDSPPLEDFLQAKACIALCMGAEFPSDFPVLGRNFSQGRIIRPLRIFLQVKAASLSVWEAEFSPEFPSWGRIFSPGRIVRPNIRPQISPTACSGQGYLSLSSPSVQNS